ncbi:MAG: magnesium transporter [Bacilli bacterium]|nr:magnesium transporter [Bacilli bacterium]
MATHEEILRLFTETTDLSQLRQQLNHYHPRDLAECFQTLEEKDQAKIYAVFSNEELAEIFAYLEADDVSELTQTLSEEKLASIIKEMEPDDAADLLSEYSDDRAELIYHFIDTKTKDELTKLQEYDEDTAGSLMNSNYLAIEKGKDIKDLMKKLVKEAPDLESINTTFVIDELGKLLGIIPLKQVIIAKSPCQVETIMNTNVKSVDVQMNIAEVVNVVKNYDIFDLPVLDDGILKGIITIDDAMEAIVARADEDYAKLAGLTDVEESEESTVSSVKKRIPWLAFLLIMDIFIAIIISKFDYLFALDKMTVFVFFQPIILGLAGNFGTQSLAITIRKLTDDDFAQKKGIIKHLIRETILGMLTGIILGFVALLFSGIFLYINDKSSTIIIEVAFVVGLSVLVSLMISSLFGSLMPIVLYKLKLDPAVASGPVITTIIDILSIVIYLTLATLIVYNQLI